MALAAILIEAVAAAQMTPVERLNAELLAARTATSVLEARCAALGLADGQKVKVGSARGTVTLHAKSHDGQRRGVLIAESIWPNDAFEDGQGINTLTGADQPAPNGGGAFHDNRVWIRAA